MMTRRIPIRYTTLGVFDIISTFDSALAVKAKKLAVADYVFYDYVPNMNPSDVLFESMYAKSIINGVSATDISSLYERVDIKERSITVNDAIPIFEDVSIVKL
jgi:hypothetical protein